MDSVQQILGSIDQRVLIAIVVILVILLIISIIKKLINLAVLVIMGMLLCSFVLPIVKEYQEKYNFQLDNGKLTMTVDEEVIEINKDTCKGIKLNGKSENDEFNYSVSIIVEDKEIEVDIPKFMEEGLVKFAESSNILVEKDEE